MILQKLLLSNSHKIEPVFLWELLSSNFCRIIKLFKSYVTCNLIQTCIIHFIFYRCTKRLNGTEINSSISGVYCSSVCGSVSFEGNGHKVKHSVFLGTVILVHSVHSNNINYLTIV